MTELEPAGPHPARTARWGPWRLPPSGDQKRATRLLLLHGFGSSPGELRPMGRTLARLGFEVACPLLPGHGESVEAMRHTALDDWRTAVTKTYGALHQDGYGVAVVGFCLGGALALDLAQRVHPRALALLATPVLPPPESQFPPLTPDGRIRSLLPCLLDADSQESKRWRSEGGHKTVPTEFFERYKDAIATAREALPKVKAPLFVAQSRADRTVSPVNAEVIIGEVGSLECRLAWSRKAGHALPIDRGRRNLYRELARFLIEQDEPVVGSHRHSLGSGFSGRSL